MSVIVHWIQEQCSITALWSLTDLSLFVAVAAEFGESEVDLLFLPFLSQWMYIVPIVIFLMMSGAQDPNGGSGGSGGGGR